MSSAAIVGSMSRIVTRFAGREATRAGADTCCLTTISVDRGNHPVSMAGERHRRPYIPVPLKQTTEWLVSPS